MGAPTLSPSYTLDRLMPQDIIGFYDSASNMGHDELVITIQDFASTMNTDLTKSYESELNETLSNDIKHALRIFHMSFTNHP